MNKKYVVFALCVVISKNSAMSLEKESVTSPYKIIAKEKAQEEVLQAIVTDDKLLLEFFEIVKRRQNKDLMHRVNEANRVRKQLDRKAMDVRKKEDKKMVIHGKSCTRSPIFKKPLPKKEKKIRTELLFNTL